MEWGKSVGSWRLRYGELVARKEAVSCCIYGRDEVLFGVNRTVDWYGFMNSDHVEHSGGLINSCKRSLGVGCN